MYKDQSIVVPDSPTTVSKLEELSVMFTLLLYDIIFSEAVMAVTVVERLTTELSGTTVIL